MEVKDENERLLQEQVRAYEKKILKLQKDHRCIMEENFQFKIKLHEKDMKFIRVLIVLD